MIVVGVPETDEHLPGQFRAGKEDTERAAVPLGPEASDGA